MHEYHEVKKRVAEERTKEEGEEILVEPGPRILPFCHSEWGAVSDLGGSFHTLIFRCFVLIPSLCLLSASFFPLC